MSRPTLHYAVAVLMLALTTGGLVAAPPEPPEDATVLRKLPRMRAILPIPLEVFRDDLVILSTFGNGQWTCKVSYLETVRLPRLGWTFRRRVMTEVTAPPPAP